MCRFKSYVVTKDRIFHSLWTDSHENIIEQNGLKADGTHGPNIVRVEVTPNHSEWEYSPEKPKWNYRVDQDSFPQWHDSTTTRQRVMKFHADFVKTHIKPAKVKKTSLKAKYFTHNGERCKVLAVFTDPKDPRIKNLTVSPSGTLLISKKHSGNDAQWLKDQLTPKAYKDLGGDKVLADKGYWVDIDSNSRAYWKVVQ